MATPADVLHRLRAGAPSSLVLVGGPVPAGLADEIIGFTAGLMLGADGRPAVGMMGIGALADAPRYRLADSNVIGPDLMHRWVRA